MGGPAIAGIEGARLECLHAAAPSNMNNEWAVIRNYPGSVFRARNSMCGARLGRDHPGPPPHVGSRSRTRPWRSGCPTKGGQGASALSGTGRFREGAAPVEDSRGQLHAADPSPLSLPPRTRSPPAGARSGQGAVHVGHLPRRGRPQRPPRGGPGVPPRQPERSRGGSGQSLQAALGSRTTPGPGSRIRRPQAPAALLLQRPRRLTQGPGPEIADFP
ncbi:hypothetical protein NDU88_004806 [Pleurodeles waltl]|uniref:Uncharacterized protein n=1 Tax=Pleurodeles waltl TaxID=8319 RepID=A0AAV7NUT1_PLEWA|nr:hypothetical protein NDU88_004806 [Pleurodeles waltl]